MTRKLKILFIFVVFPLVLALAVVGLGTIAFVARVGWQTANEVAFEALNEAIGLKRQAEARAGSETPPERQEQSVRKTKSYPEARQDYHEAMPSDAAERCLSVADDPDRLLECIRQETPEGDPLGNGASAVAGRTLRTQELPLFDPGASVIRRARDGGIAIDYVDVRLTTRDPQDTLSVKVGFHDLQGPRFLVLYGDSDTEWRLGGTDKVALEGILVVTDFRQSNGSIRGVPEDVPVWRYSFPENAKRLLPHVAGIIPSCREREGGRVECANAPRWRKRDKRAPFQIVDDWVHSMFGRRIDTFSRLSATRSGFVVVPMEIVTEETRDALKRELERARLQLAEYQVKVERRGEYEQRWRAERFATATAELSERPPFSPANAAPRANEIVLVSLYETATRRKRSKPQRRIFDSYSEFKTDADENVRPVLVRIDVEKPIILILSAHAPVDWVLDVEDPKMLTAVRIEGVNVPGFRGLPTSVPVRIISSVLGAERALPFLNPKKPRVEAFLADIRDDFGGLPLRLISNYRTDSIEITD